MKQLKIVSIPCIIAALFLSATAWSATTEIRCPAQINTSEKLLKLPADFESMSTEAPQYWNNVIFYSGLPKDNASLAPDAPKNDVWTFSREDTVYLGCLYNQSKIMLFKKLPNQTVHCKMVMDKNVQGPFDQGVPEKILCKTA